MESLDIKVAALANTRIIRKEIIDTTEYGILNSHPGIIPYYRGLDVVGWAILNGDQVGATCHYITEQPDSGPILMTDELRYNYGDTLMDIRIENMKNSNWLLVTPMVEHQKLD